MLRLRLSPHRRGFSLIEILVTMTIILILTALSFVGITEVIKREKQVRAKAFMARFQSSLKEYEANYGDWPRYVTNFTDSTNDILIPADSTNWAALIDILRATKSNPDTAPIVSQNNPQERSFMDFKDNELAFDKTPLLATNLVDPWGNGYILAIDYNRDGIISGLPDIKTGITNTYSNALSVAVYSTAGAPDGSNPDNVKTWIGTWQ